jgi:hypothetical protein
MTTLGGDRVALVAGILRPGTFLLSDVVAALQATQPQGTRPTDLPWMTVGWSSATHLLGSACCGTDS